MNANRRAFIKTVILGTGAVFLDWADVAAHASVGKLPARVEFQHFGDVHAFVLGDKAWPQASREETIDYAIIGGGAAGVAAAWQLKKANTEFVLLENESDIGGVMRVPKPAWNGIKYPLGSTYFVRRDGVFNDMLVDLNVRPIETGEDAFLFDGTSCVVDPWNPKNIASLPISPKDREAFRAFRDFVLAIRVAGYSMENVASDTTREYDAMSAHQFVARFGSSVLAEFMELYSRSVLGASLRDASAFAFLNFYSVEFGDAFGLPCWTVPGGLGSITAAAHGFIGSSHITCGAAVVRVENTRAHAGVDISCINRSTGELYALHAKKAIVCTSKQIARRMIPDLPADQSAAMGELKYAPYITVALLCTAPLFPKRAFDYWLPDSKGRFTDILDATVSQDAQAHQRTRNDAFAYMVSCPRPAGSFAGMDESKLGRYLAQFAQDIVDAVEENIRGAREKIQQLHVFGWGHSMVIPSVGAYTRLAPVLSRPHGNIHFANSDNDVAPGWENAIIHGVETARRVMG